MTLNEAIKHVEEIAEENQRVVDTGIVFNDVTIDMLYCDDTEIIDEHLANYQSRAEEYRQIAEWLKDYKRLLEQEPCDNEYIKVPKKALKYRTAGMVTYNAEWLKNHFDMERAIICGEQESCEDCIKIPEGATNGDMMRGMFPNMRTYESGLDHLNIEVRIGEYPAELTMNVSGKWWDSPYKKEQE